MSAYWNALREPASPHCYQPQRPRKPTATHRSLCLQNPPFVGARARSVDIYLCPAVPRIVFPKHPSGAVDIAIIIPIQRPRTVRHAVFVVFFTGFSVASHAQRRSEVTSANWSRWFGRPVSGSAESRVLTPNTHVHPVGMHFRAYIISVYI